MEESRVVAAGVLAAVGLAAAASYATGSAAVLGVTPLGVAIYVGVGVALPQFLLARRTGSAVRLGVAALAGGVAAFALLVDATAFGGAGGIDLVTALAVLVVGVTLGAAVREFRAGYRARSD
jgi:hypothetical protein